jgi:hypothetical protein
MNEMTLQEPSIARVLEAIETATALPASKKTHWSCSLRQICVHLNRPPDILKARWSGIKNAVYQLHAARLGANSKTLANHKANVRTALLWFAEEKNLPKSGAPLMPVRATLMGKVVDPNRPLSPCGKLSHAVFVRDLGGGSIRRCRGHPLISSIEAFQLRAIRRRAAWLAANRVVSRR